MTDLNPGSFLATGQGANTQRLAMRLLTQDDKDISEDMQANMSNVGLVAALLLTISVPSEVLEPGEGNAWGDNAKAAAQIHGLLLGICVIACVVVRFVYICLYKQNAHVSCSLYNVFIIVFSFLYVIFFFDIYIYKDHHVFSWDDEPVGRNTFIRYESVPCKAWSWESIHG